jgi:hypothetical protein
MQFVNTGITKNVRLRFMEIVANLPTFWLEVG